MTERSKGHLNGKYFTPEIWLKVFENLGANYLKSGDC